MQEMAFLGLPNAMSRSTLDILDHKVFATRTDGDAVVARAYFGVQNLNIGRLPNMNAIRVGTVRSRRELHAFHCYIIATVDNRVKVLTVDGGQPVYIYVPGTAEFEALHLKFQLGYPSRTKYIWYKHTCPSSDM